MFDSGRWTPAESWRVIRTVRADPPERFARTLTGERKIVFHAALEQAQQQFAAAAQIGYEIRALNLFYGLSQAGRALAAASPDLHKNDPQEANRQWKSTSHGLDFAPEGSTADFWQQAVRTKPTKTDTFSRASIALGSPVDDIGSVQLGSLIAQFPDFILEWRSFGEWPRALGDGGSPWLAGSNPTFPIAEFDGEMSASAVRSFVAPYPALRGLEPVLGENGVPTLDHNGDIQLSVPDERIHRGLHAPRLRGPSSYLGGRYVLPVGGSPRRELDPLASWWMVLFAFSMLARYHPKQWTEALNLTTSKVASQIEFLLDGAVTAVPEMLARALWESPWDD